MFVKNINVMVALSITAVFIGTMVIRCIIFLLSVV